MRVYYISNEVDTSSISVTPNFSKFDSGFDPERISITYNNNAGYAYADIRYSISSSNLYLTSSGTVPLTISDGGFDTYNITDTFTIRIDNEPPKIGNIKT